MQYIKLTTSLGDIVLELNTEAAPLTTDNFLRYVQNNHYDGTIFHRVIAGFMIQGGGMNREMREKETSAPIQNEANNGLSNEKYSLAMARTSQPHSATSQFFINTKNNSFLNFTAESNQGWGYAVFGKVVEGQEVVDKMENVETTSRSYHDDVPVEPLVIEKAEILADYQPPQA